MKRIITFFLSAAIALPAIPAYAQKISRSTSAGEPIAALININRLALWIRADGLAANNPYGELSRNALQWGALYPRGKPVGVVYADGLVWGGLVSDGQQPALRVGGSTFRTGLAPGAIVAPGVAENPSDPNVNRIWRYRPDWPTADLAAEALDILISQPEAAASGFQFSSAQLKRVADSLRLVYAKDVREWPAQKGAPFVDANRNGRMDAGEPPGILNAPQVVWCVVNDLDSQLAQKLFGSPPIGLEAQITLWAYNQNSNLENSIFRRVRLIYKGTNNASAAARIDSMALAFYSEVDLGDFADDYGGTDTTLQMVYAYNSSTLDAAYQKISSAPPALGYSLIQGPIVPSANSNDRARFNFSERRGYRNLPMRSSWIDIAGDTDGQPNMGIYDGTLQYYNILNGYRPRPIMPPRSFLDPAGNPIRFSRPGDPVTNTGWIDGIPGNRQATLTTGHFKMALGDTQEVILVMTVGLGADRLASISVMKFFARHAMQLAQSNFVTSIDAPDEPPANVPEHFRLFEAYPNPLRVADDNTFTTIRYQLPAQSPVTLTIFNLLGAEVARLVEQMQAAGEYAVRWDGKTPSGQLVAAGVYFYQIQTGRFNRVKKLLVMR